MDNSKYAYFLAKFSAVNLDELHELVGRRDSLADEAIAALDTVIAERGLTTLAAHAGTASGDAVATQEQVAEIAKNTALSSALWRSGISVATKGMVVVVCLPPAQHFIGSLNLSAVYGGSSLGAVVIALVNLVVFAGVVYPAYRLGHAITRSICANGDASFTKKRLTLWLLFFALWPVLVVVNKISSLIFRS